MVDRSGTKVEGRGQKQGKRSSLKTSIHNEQLHNKREKRRGCLGQVQRQKEEDRDKGEGKKGLVRTGTEMERGRKGKSNLWKERGVVKTGMKVGRKRRWKADDWGGKKRLNRKVECVGT